MYNDGNLGKQLVYIADYTQSSTPNLDAFLKEWNVQVDYSSVIDMVFEKNHVKYKPKL